MTRKKSVTIEQVLAVAPIPLLIIALAILWAFIDQANEFAQRYFSGDWATLAVVVLIIEAFFATLFTGLFSLASGFSLALWVGSPSNLQEALIAGGCSFFVYKNFFWWLMHTGSDSLVLGNDLLPSALLVYLVILPLSQILTFIANVLCSFATYLVLDLVPGLHKRG